MRRIKKTTIVVGSVILASLVMWFQNCSQVNFGAVTEGTTSAASTSPPPDNSSVAYAWVSSGWNSCSASCGGGTQTQTVICQRNDGAAVEDGFCSGAKPAHSQTCNIEACEVDHWVTSGFGACSVSCGGGTQTQTVSCQNQNDVVVDASRCTQPAPATSQTCNTQACLTYSWVKSGWGSCSAVCGGGTQNQTVACQDNLGHIVADSFCSSSPKPPTAQDCNPQACLTYNWSQGGFGACSVSCGGGTQTQTVSCKDSNGNVVADNLCTGTKPAASQSCNPQACVTYHWQQGGWGICSATCGGGTQTQTVTCVNNSGVTVDSSYCAGAAPPTTQACNTQTCPYTYHVAARSDAVNWPFTGSCPANLTAGMGCSQPNTWCYTEPGPAYSCY